MNERVHFDILVRANETLTRFSRIIFSLNHEGLRFLAGAQILRRRAAFLAMMLVLYLVFDLNRAHSYQQLPSSVISELCAFALCTGITRLIFESLASHAVGLPLWQPRSRIAQKNIRYGPAMRHISLIIG